MHGQGTCGSAADAAAAPPQSPPFPRAVLRLVWQGKAEEAAGEDVRNCRDDAFLPHSAGFRCCCATVLPACAGSAPCSASPFQGGRTAHLTPCPSLPAAAACRAFPAIRASLQRELEASRRAAASPPATYELPEWAVEALATWPAQGPALQLKVGLPPCPCLQRSTHVRMLALRRRSAERCGGRGPPRCCRTRADQA
jgi:hypothetical protein